MPVFQTTATQGITEETQTVITAPRSSHEAQQQNEDLIAFVRRQARLNTFDGRVGDLEKNCREIWSHHRTQDDDANTAPALGSRAWYAHTILLAISAARSAMARGEISLAMSEAVEVGAWITEAQAKFGPWANLLLGEARIRTNRELGRRGAASVRRKAEARDREILREAAAYRRTFPEVTTEHSTRNMAKHISRRLEMKEGTVRDRLRKHQKR